MVKTKAPKTGKSAPKASKKIEVENDLFQNIVAVGKYSIDDLLVPLLEEYSKKSVTSTEILIVTHDRENALSIRKTIRKTITDQGFTAYLAIKGNSAQTEVHNLEKSTGAVIGTAERLKFHMEHTKKFDLSQVKFLVIHDLNSLANAGHLELLESLYKHLPVDVITRLTTLQRTAPIDSFISSHLPSRKLLEKPLSLDANKLFQHYVNVTPDKKFILLFTLISRNLLKKTLVLFSCASEAKFFKKLLGCLGIKTTCSTPQNSSEKNEKAHSSFTKGNCQILLSTMIASSTCKFGSIDYLILYDLPNVADYSMFSSAKAAGKIIFFIDGDSKTYMQTSSLLFIELKFSGNKLLNVQGKVEKIIERNYELHKAARNGYRDYILSAKRSDYHLVAKSFGLAKAPLVNGLKD